MTGRFEVRETTKNTDFSRGLHEVMITDLVSGMVGKGRATTYAQAEREAWYKLKELQAAAPAEIDTQDYTPF